MPAGSAGGNSKKNLFELKFVRFHREGGGVLRVPGRCATPAMKRRPESAKTFSLEFVAVAEDGNTPHLENTP